MLRNKLHMTKNGKNIVENKTKTVIKIGTETEFFSNARKVMQKLDKKEPIEDAHIITFDNPVDMMKFITSKKILNQAQQEQ